MEKLNEDQGRKYTGLSEQDLNERLATNMPNITILGDTILWERKQDINFGKIKRAYADNFENYQDIERHQLKWLSGLQKKCIKADCNEPFSSIHISSTHTLCVAAQDLTHDEIPYRYELSAFVQNATKSCSIWKDTYLY